MDNNELIKIAALACEDKKAVDINIINISNVSSIADWILVSEGLSDVQVRAIVKSVEDEIKAKANLNPLRKEGIHEAKWALLDYGDFIINIFQPKERKFYELESFWSNGTKYEFKNK